MQASLLAAALITSGADTARATGAGDVGLDAGVAEGSLAVASILATCGGVLERFLPRGLFVLALLGGVLLALAGGVLEDVLLFVVAGEARIGGAESHPLEPSPALAHWSDTKPLKGGGIGGGGRGASVVGSSPCF